VQERIEAGLPRLTPRTIATPGALTRELQDVRTEGTAHDREESHVGISCVAAPVFGSNRRVRAGLSITGRTGSIDPVRYGVAVRTAAFTLSRVLRESGL
jgi:DNA-binding IclR family transcriptional regulator